ncbi:hypothetical protein THASP1DRAFT_26957 [Thamnocephalis sphaerospora]|uniref:Uncharacterized protein n=1 Tax=Thamnocephalis sphaerospora TaxID=78915 RepID=A0A4P9XGW6_9FUNG|nr:hypothetical protein THASP1DRAFT_26957 [Thamnocephalis sphaerospora]|eukprot:RKP04420.1 hypothetical protein THASP1DRAFT_26957 [Thamnocephalis sphaerospora]
MTDNVAPPCLAQRLRGEGLAKTRVRRSNGARNAPIRRGQGAFGRLPAISANRKIRERSTNSDHSWAEKHAQKAVMYIHRCPFAKNVRSIVCKIWQALVCYWEDYYGYRYCYRSAAALADEDSTAYLSYGPSRIDDAAHMLDAATLSDTATPLAFRRVTRLDRRPHKGRGGASDNAVILKVLIAESLPYASVFIYARARVYDLVTCVRTASPYRAQRIDRSASTVRTEAQPSDIAFAGRRFAV